MRKKEEFMSSNRGVAGYACPKAVLLDGVTQARYQAQHLALGQWPDAKRIAWQPAGPDAKCPPSYNTNMLQK